MAELRKAQLPFGVTAMAEQAAIASLAGERELLRRVEVLVQAGAGAGIAASVRGDALGLGAEGLRRDAGGVAAGALGGRGATGG